MSKAKSIFFQEVFGFFSVGLAAYSFIMGDAVIGYLTLALSQIFFTHADVLRL